MKKLSLIISFSLLSAILSQYAFAEVLPCSTVSLPQWPKEFVQASAEQMRSEPFKKICAQVMPYCENIWYGTESKIMIVVGSIPLEPSTIQKKTKSQFINQIPLLVEQYKKNYTDQSTQSTLNYDIDHKLDNILVANIVAQYPDEGKLSTDIRKFYFFDSSCRLDFLFSGRSDTITDFNIEINSELENFRNRLIKNHPNGMNFSKNNYFSTSVTLEHIILWIVSLAISFSVVKVAFKKNNFDIRSKPLNYWLIFLAVFVGIIVVFMPIGTWICIHDFEGQCKAGIPGDFNFLFYYLPYLFILISTLTLRSPQSRLALTLSIVIGLSLGLIKTIYFLGYDGINLGNILIIIGTIYFGCKSLVRT